MRCFCTVVLPIAVRLGATGKDSEVVGCEAQRCEVEYPRRDGEGIDMGCIWEVGCKGEKTRAVSTSRGLDRKRNQVMSSFAP